MYNYALEDAQADYNIMSEGGLEHAIARREAEEDARHEGWIAAQEEAENIALYGPAPTFTLDLADIPF